MFNTDSLQNPAPGAPQQLPALNPQHSLSLVNLIPPLESRNNLKTQHPRWSSCLSATDPQLCKFRKLQTCLHHQCVSVRTQHNKILAPKHYVLPEHMGLSKQMCILHPAMSHYRAHFLKRQHPQVWTTSVLCKFCKHSHVLTCHFFVESAQRPREECHLMLLCHY